MKTLPDAIIAGMRGDSKRVILVRIIPESGDTWGELLWATRDITITDWEGGGVMKTFQGGMLAEGKLGTIKQSIDIRQGGNVAKVSGLTLTICNPEYKDTDRFDQSFTSNLENRKVEIRTVFWTGSNPAWSDTLLLYKGVVEDVNYDYGIYKIKVRDAGFKRHKEIPDLILDEDNYPKAPATNNGAVIPLAYGVPSDGDYRLHNLYRAPIIKCNEQKEEFLVSRNKSSNVCDENVLYIFFPSINRYGVLYRDSGGFDITYGRPTKLSFPLGIQIKGLLYSQASSQGSKTDPTSINFANAVDNDLDTHFTLSPLNGGEKLYLKIPIPEEFARIVYETAGSISLMVLFGNVTGTGGYLKYYNPEWDAGVGGFSDGQSFGVGTPLGNVAYTFGTDKTKHGREDDQADQNNTWIFDEIANYEWGIEMNAGSTAQIKNIYIYLGNMVARGVVKVTVRPPQRRRREPHRKIERTDEVQSLQMLYTFINGEQFGAWIDADSRDNGYNENGIIKYGAYIIECILRSELGLTSTEIDYESFDAIGNTTDGDRKDWMFDGLIQKQADSLEIIAQYCREASLCYFQDYKNKEKIVALKKETAIKTIDQTTIQQGRIDVEYSDLQSVFNEFYLRYKKMNDDTYGATKFVTAADHNLSSNTRSGTPNTYTGLCSDSQSKYNLTKRFEIKCDWIRDDATAEKLIKWFAEWHCYRKHIIEFETDGLDDIGLELGDQVKIDHTLLPTGVSNDACFLLYDVSHNLDRDRMKFKFMQIPDLLP